uniref:Reverse transcriptase domain-containing protein n=1 Tax=Leptobrachium leishanense TaxID=445787 RepID=A0A8C5MLB2_9ANUR
MAISTSAMMADLKIISQNVKGLNSPTKRRLVLRDLRRSGCQIAFLQETHFTRTRQFSLTDRSFTRSFLASATTKHGGVAILLHKKCDFTVLHCESDAEGRYVLLRGTMAGHTVTFINMYAPNAPDATFWERLENLVKSTTDSLVIVGGDLNATPVPAIDRRGPTSGVIHKGTPQDKQLARFLTDTHLLDVWRLQHPGEHDFTFFSHPHSSHSRIDLFFLPPTSMQWATRSEIGNISWSDHAPVSLWISLPGVKAPWSWRLNFSLLQNPEVRAEITAALDRYFLDNDTEGIHSDVLWLAHKPVIRGLLIQIGSRLKRERLQRLSDLQALLADREAAHKISRTQGDYEALLLVQQDLRAELTSDAARSLAWSKRSFYEYSNKAHTFLARKLRNQHRSHAVTSARTPSGGNTTEPGEVNRIFTEFFKQLYNHSPTHTPSNQDHVQRVKAYLSRWKGPALSQACLDCLDEEVTEAEVLLIIRGLKPHKSPGPDGFSASYYKSFSAKLLPHMTKLYNELLGGSPVAPDFLRSDVILIPKEGKDPALPQNHRPISLLNVDYKIFTKLLANRLGGFLPSLVHPDQVGFVPSRQAFENTRRAVVLIERALASGTPSLLLSLDAEKAFDRVEWTYMFELLEQWGFPPRFRAALRALYAAPLTRILTPGANPETFPIGNGTRQGCPLSPLLFALSLEPLLANLRASSTIRGLGAGGEEFLVSAYADDVLLTIADPLHSIPPLLSAIDSFSGISGYKVNYDKTRAMPLGLTRE